MATMHRPGYAHGMSIPLAHARWVKTHIVDRIEGSGGEIVLHSAGSSLTLISTWGIYLQEPSNGRSLVALREPIDLNMDDILAYEAAHPDEPKIGARR